MKILILLLFSSSVVFVSCSKDSSENSKKNSANKAKVVSKHKNIQDQEPPPREIIDINEEGFSVDEVLKIDEEIPILEIIVGKSWKQADLDKLGKMQMLDTLRLEDMPAENLDLSFTKSIKSLKIVSFKNSKVNLATIKSLAGSSVSEIDCTNTNLPASEIDSLSSILPKAKVKK